MALNPFFQQGTASEQRLVQDLINEQLRMYGIEIVYIPRKFVRKQTIIEEIQSSKFDDNYAIEAYVNTYDGYSGAGDILTKFGMSLRDELTVTISRERFEDFISPFLSGSDPDEITLATRPREGDLIYFPLGERLFEVKFVEHEQPFYQLGKTYVYELKCELFEYEDEVLDTTIDEIDTQIDEEGYITTLNLIGIGRTATAVAILNTGYIKEVFLNNDGYGYTTAPLVAISTSPTGQTGDNATAVAITTNRGGIYSVERLLLTNPGAGYTVPPTITFYGGGGGAGAAATCSIETSLNGVQRIVITDNGTGYAEAPIITITKPKHVGAAATAIIGSPIGSGVSVVDTVISTGSPNYLFPGGTTGGVFYQTPPIVTFSLPTGVVGGIATAIVTMGDYATTGGIVSSITIPSETAGAFYVSPPSISISHPGFSFASATIGIAGSSINPASLVFTSTGRAYTTAPTVAISTGGIYGTNAPLVTAVGIATINPITGVVTAIGFNPTTDPWCVGTGATVGLGYTVAPLLTFFGLPSARGATASATVSAAGTISGVILTDTGFGYANGVTATATISTPTGTPEQFRATGIATLRSNSVKTVGTISIGSSYISGIDTTGILVGDRIRTQYTYNSPYPEISMIPNGTYVSSIGIGTIFMSGSATNVGLATTSFEFGIDQCGIVTGIILTYGGGGYLSPPTITITNDPSEKNYVDLNPGITTATARTGIITTGIVNATYIESPGRGYIITPEVTITSPSIITGIGTYQFNEIVRGSRSNLQARVKSWDADTKVLKVSMVGVGTTTRTFLPDEIIIGTASSARYSVKSYDEMDVYDKYSQNDEIEEEADLILDFSQSNPFGTY
jgi:hypothetical protein